MYSAAAYIQMRFRLGFVKEANTMNPDQFVCLFDVILYVPSTIFQL